MYKYRGCFSMNKYELYKQAAVKIELHQESDGTRLSCQHAKHRTLEAFDDRFEQIVALPMADGSIIK
jgi:hypothetical protein